MSLIKERILMDSENRRRAEKSVEGVTIRPTQTEREIVDTLIQQVSENFKRRYLRMGFPAKCRRKLEVMLEVRSSSLM